MGQPYAYGPATLDPDQEKGVLKNQMALLNQQLEAIRARLDEIEAPAGEGASE